MPNVVEQLEELQGEIEAAGAKISELTNSLEESKAYAASVEAERDALKAEVATEKQNVVDAVKAASETAEALKTENETLKADAETARAELETAKAILERPEFADALARGDGTAVSEGGSPSGDTGEPTTRDEALAMYRKMSDAKEKAAFRAEYRELLGL